MELALMGIFMLLSFALGFYLAKPEEKKVEVVKVQKKEKKEAKKEQELDDATVVMLRNIDNYTGSSLGQEDVPEEV